MIYILLLLRTQSKLEEDIRFFLNFRTW